MAHHYVLPSRFRRSVHRALIAHTESLSASACITLMTMSPNVATTGRPQSLLFYLNRHGVGPVIANDFRGDFCAPSFRRKERIDITFSFLAGYQGPTAFDSALEEIAIRIGHTETP